MIPRDEAVKRLNDIGILPDEAIDLAEAGLLLGAVDNAMDGLERSRRHIEELVQRAKSLAPSALSISARAAVLSQILYEEAGYEGDRTSYDDPDNANLIRVIQRRRGLPVALGLLYIHLGERLDWPVRGLSVPGHFVVRLADENDQAVLDPFNGGARLETLQLRMLLKQALGSEAELEPGHLADVSKRDVLLRLQNNLKSRALQDRKIDQALLVLERMCWIAPQEAALWYERGMLESEMGHLVAAAGALTICRERTKDRSLLQNADLALAKLRRRLN